MLSQIFVMTALATPGATLCPTQELISDAEICYEGGGYDTPTNVLSSKAQARSKPSAPRSLVQLGQAKPAGQWRVHSEATPVRGAQQAFDDDRHIGLLFESRPGPSESRNTRLHEPASALGAPVSADPRPHKSRSDV